MTSQIPKNQNYNAFTKVLLLRYNFNHGTHMYHCPLKGNTTHKKFYLKTGTAVSPKNGHQLNT